MNNFYQRVAHLLPKPIVYYCIIRAFAAVTYDEWGSDELENMTVRELLALLDI